MIHITSFSTTINPEYIRNQFKDKEGFAIWCYNNTIEDLNCILRIFLDQEMYEDCAIIRDVMNYKKTN